MSEITIRTSDGVIVGIPRQYTQLLGNIYNLTQDVPDASHIDDVKISSKTMMHVIGFLPWLYENRELTTTRYNTAEKEKADIKYIRVRPTDYEKEYFSKITDYREYFTLIEEIDWATTPESPELLHCITLTFAWLWIKDKTPAQIAAKWGFTDDDRKKLKEYCECKDTKPTMEGLQKIVPQSIIDVYNLVSDPTLMSIL